MNFLGIDIGTSFIKAAILDTCNNDIKNIRSVKALPKMKTPYLHAEYSIKDMMSIMRNLIDEYTKNFDIKGITFSSQMHGFLLSDEEGNPETNFISWEDERATKILEGTSKSYIDTMCERINKEDMIKSGLIPTPGYAYSTLFYLKSNNIIDKNKCYILYTIGDYVTSNLTGEYPSTHISNAASTGLTDVEKKEWNKNIINALGFENIKFPKIINANDICGYLKINDRDIPVFPSVGDHQAAVLGINIKEETELSINIGTGSQVSIIKNKAEFGNFQTRPFFDGHYLNSIPHIPAGRAINVLFNFVEDIGKRIYNSNTEVSEVWKKIDKLTSKIDSTDLVVNPYFFRSVIEKSTGSIENINVSNLKVDNMFYGAFFNMIENYYKLSSRIITNDSINSIVLSGGLGKKNKLISRFIEQKFKMDVKISANINETLIGLLSIVKSYCDKCSIIESRNNI